MQETICEQLAGFLVKMGYKDLPKPVIEKAKLVILDTIGCMIAASTTEKGKAMGSYFSSVARAGKSTMLGTKRRYSPEMASFANGSYGHMLEYDDGHRPSDNHLACVTVPSALAVCEAEQLKGADFITAFIAGYEIMGRVGRAVVLPRAGQHFHGTGICGPFGGAAAAGKALGLDKTQMANAIAISADSSGGFKEVMISGFDCKPLHAGRAAFNGVSAAYMSRYGITGPNNIIEGEHGFCRAMTAEYTLEPILAGLFENWEIDYSGFKVHSTCGITFTAVDCLLDIMKENQIKTDQIASIKIGVPPRVLASETNTRRAPRSVGEARFSVLYAVAVGALKGRVGLSEISEEQIKSVDSLRMANLTEMVADKEAEEVEIRDKDKPMFFPPAAVDLVTKDGRHFRRFRSVARGYDPIGSPLTSDEVADKFKSLAKFGLTDRQAETVIDIVSHLEEYKDLAPLSNVLIG